MDNRWDSEGIRFVPVDINKVVFANRPKEEKEEAITDIKGGQNNG